MNVTRLGVRKALTSITRPSSICFNPQRLTPIQQRWNSSNVARLPSFLDDGDVFLKNNGVEGLFSKMGFEYAWFDYQTYVLNGLLERYAGGTYIPHLLYQTKAYFLQFQANAASTNQF
jgi:hypothetical protein